MGLVAHMPRYAGVVAHMPHGPAAVVRGLWHTCPDTRGSWPTRPRRDQAAGSGAQNVRFRLAHEKCRSPAGQAEIGWGQTGRAAYDRTHAEL